MLLPRTFAFTTRSAAFIALIACGGGGAAVAPGDAPATLALDSVAVNPVTVTLGVGGTFPLSVAAFATQGRSVSGAAFSFASNNASVATVDNSGLIRGIAPGTASITVTATLNAVTLTRVVAVTVTAAATTPTSTTVTTSGNTFQPSAVTIGVGGTVVWQITGATHNVTFGTAEPPGGDIPDTAPGNSASRTFTAAGTYDYECTRHSGMTGRVTVQSAGPAGQFASLSLTPPATFVTPGGTSQLTATPLDANGQPIGGLGTPTFTSSNTAVATVNASGLVTGVANGNALVIATLTVTGVTRADTTAVTVGNPSGTVTTTANRFVPEDLNIPPGGTVLWEFSGATHNVTFRDQQPPGGNIPNSPPGTRVARTFPAGGDYDYVCTLHDGMKGRIRVR